MKIKTQRDALSWLLTIGERIDHQVQRYESSASGAQTKASAARDIADLFAQRANIYRQLAGLFSGLTANGLMVITAAEAGRAAESSRASWLRLAYGHQADADRIAQEAALAFLPETNRDLVSERRRKRTLSGPDAVAARREARRTHGTVTELDSVRADR